MYDWALIRIITSTWHTRRIQTDILPFTFHTQVVKVGTRGSNLLREEGEFREDSFGQQIPFDGY